MASISKINDYNSYKETPDNKINMENKEFVNSRVPLEGIELLLKQDKVPDDLGKRMDTKNIKESIKNHSDNDAMTDLDDIISDAESISDAFTNKPDEKHEERLKRRIKMKKTGSFHPKTKLSFRKPRHSPRQDDIPNDDISEIVSADDNEIQSISDNVSVSGESVKSANTIVSESSGESNFEETESKWKSPSRMSKDEIMSEKVDLLYRYGRLEQNGYKSGLDLNTRTPLEVLRSEVSKLERMRTVQRSIRTQRKILVSFASGTEYVNKRYNPYKFALDGWSGEVLENIGDYDEVFEELHDKYKDSVQMAPELKLLTMVGGSGLMFHLSNTLFKSSTPELNDILQRNPDIMAQIQKEALNSMSGANASDPIFNMMMQGVQEKERQQSQQPQWNGRPGYAPPRTSNYTIPNPQPSNMANNTFGTNVQQTMNGPEGFDDILSQLNQGTKEQTHLHSDNEETKEVKTKKPRKKNNKTEIIDLD